MEEQPKMEHSQEEPPRADELALCEKEKSELINLSKRLKADFVNYKKDQEKVMQAFVKFAARDVIERLLPVLDSFELAVQHIPKEFEANGWVKGVAQTKQQIETVLKDVGVAEIPAHGAQFDPSLHEAVAEEAAEGEEGKVVDVLQKGYMLHGEVIRPAKVKVSKKKE